MGREAIVHAEVDRDSGEVRALLESGELILRGDVRRRFARSTLQGVSVHDGVLAFTSGGEHVRLHLGERTAEAWRAALAKAPPSLRTKFGLTGDAKAHVVGIVDDPLLAEALAGHTAERRTDAAMIVACIGSAGDLDVALKAHGAGVPVPLWTIYPKGRGAVFGDASIRDALRAAGLKDTKSSSVSDRLTATRYNAVQPHQVKLAR